ncbi:MAG: (d)CMP kinase, partial [Candidatus Binatia bacterium]
REQGIDPDDGRRLGELAARARIRLEPRAAGGQAVFVDGRDVTAEIRGQEIGEWASKVSTRGEVRDHLVRLQREIARDGGAVLEGRDIGTVVFPDADVKFFLEASAEERGRRRFRQLRDQGRPAAMADIVAEIEERDRRDRTRDHSPLRCAADAERVDSTGLSAEEVVGRLLGRCRRALGGGPQKP